MGYTTSTNYLFSNTILTNSIFYGIIRVELNSTKLMESVQT